MHDVHHPFTAFEAGAIDTAPGDTAWPLHQLNGWRLDDAGLRPPAPSLPHPGVADVLLDAAEIRTPVAAPPRQPAFSRAAHRKQSAHRRQSPYARLKLQPPGSALGAMTAVTVLLVCTLSWIFSYGLLRDLARQSVRYGPVQAWPFVVFGPWLVGSLSVLRSALDNSRVSYGWSVVVLFSGLTTTLCALHAQATVLTVVIAGLPPISSLVALHQIVRQVASARHPRRSRGARSPGAPS